ncbi:MAG: hypothetical protein JSU63_08720, partial [Phycisphaerales bacterium]
GRRAEKYVSDVFDVGKTERYLYDGQKIIETRDGSGNMVQQFIAPLTRRTPQTGGAALRHAGFACGGESRANGTQYTCPLCEAIAECQGSMSWS